MINCKKIQQKDITIINRHSSIDRDMNAWSRNVTEMKVIDKSTITNRDFNIPISIMDTKSGSKINKEIKDITTLQTNRHNIHL